MREIKCFFKDCTPNYEFLVFILILTHIKTIPIICTLLKTTCLYYLFFVVIERKRSAQERKSKEKSTQCLERMFEADIHLKSNVTYAIYLLNQSIYIRKYEQNNQLDLQIKLTLINVSRYLSTTSYISICICRFHTEKTHGRHIKLIALHQTALWCPEEESNFHGVVSTRT